MSSTRARILGAARELTERNGSAPTMSQLARAASISRQALYLHFPDRAALLVALVAHVDEHEDLHTGIAAVQAAPDAAGQIRAWAQMQVRRNPKIAPIARALDQARHADQAASAAWRDRTGNRMRGAAAIIARLREEGRLHPNWNADEAALLLSELTSFRVWDDLVSHAKLAPARYVEIITSTALAALASPVSEPPSPGQPPATNADKGSVQAVQNRRAAPGTRPG